MKQITNMTIDEELLQKIEKKSIKEDRSKSWIVNDILKEYFEVGK